MEEAKLAKNKKLKIVIVLLILISLTLVNYIAWQYWKSTRVDQTTRYWFDKYAKSGILEGKSKEDIQTILSSVVEDGMFNIVISPYVYFDNGKATGELNIENIPANHYYCQVSLILKESGDEIYRSDGIKPGQYIDKIKLNKNLKKGEYDTLAKVTVTDPKTLVNIGEIIVDITLVVLN